jgi:branched-chain amino acid transport system permease protein
MDAGQLLLQQLLNGLTLGAIYAMIALGYTLVYGVIQLINFAHGEVFLCGAYLALSTLLVLGPAPLPWWGVLLIMVAASMAVSAWLGWVIDWAAYRPVRRAPRLNAFITAIGVSFFLQNALMLLYGATDRRFPHTLPSVSWQWNGVSISLMQAVIGACTIAVMGVLYVLVIHTRLGKAMRATAQDHLACALLGIPVNRVVALTFMLGAGVAALGGTLFGMHYGTINFHDGYLMGMKAFTAAVLGGVGNIPGAFVGGLALGVVEGLAAGYLSAQWKNVLAFALLVLLLLFRPTGLLGERVAERA